MSTFVFPGVTPTSTTWTLESNTGTYVSPLTGAVQTIDRGGERWRVTMNFQNTTSTDRAKLQAFLTQLNGQQHRFKLPDHSYTKRGSITSTELHPALLAANFTDGGAAWLTLTNVTNGIRVKRENDVSNGTIVRPTTEATTTAARSYAYKSGIVSYAGLQSYGRHSHISESGGTNGALYDSGAASHATAINVTGVTATDSGIRAGFADNNLSLSYTQFDITQSSLSRCLLVDNGVNKILQSQTFDNASWTKSNSSITADASPYPTLAPDGTQTADELIEASDTGQTHQATQTITRSSNAEFWTASVYLKQNTNQRIRLQFTDGSSNGAYGIFDASSGTITAGPGDLGSATHTFGTIISAGNGWYRCRITSKIPATTSVLLQIILCDGASNTTTYNGDGSSSVFIWGAQLQQGGQLGRYVATTTTANSGSSQTGTEIWVKGLDADTDGQLLAGDQVEINGHLYKLLSDLDGDPSGVGLMRVTPRILTAPSDEDAVVIHEPADTFMLANGASGWSSVPGVFSDFTIEAVSDILA